MNTTIPLEDPISLAQTIADGVDYLVISRTSHNDAPSACITAIQQNSNMALP